MHKTRTKLGTSQLAIDSLPTSKLRTVRGGDDTPASTQSNGTITIGTHPPSEP